jgi:hypothetical protein
LCKWQGFLTFSAVFLCTASDWNPCRIKGFWVLFISFLY